MKTAMTCGVSTVTSRSLASPTSEVAAGALGGGAASPADCGAGVFAVEDGVAVDAVEAGFGAGREKKVWYAYKTRNDMKSAMRTRRSNSVPWRHRIVTAGAEWLTPRETLESQPGSLPHAINPNGVGGVVGTRWQEPARAGEERRENELVTAKQEKRRTYGYARIWLGRRYRLSTVSFLAMLRAVL